MKPHKVLVVSDVAEFVREVVGCWERETEKPRVTVLSPDSCRQARSASYALAIVGPVRNGGMALSNTSLPFRSTVCAVVDSSLLHLARQSHPEWVLIPEQPGWQEILVSLTHEVLRRTAAEAHVEAVEKWDLEQKRLARVGGALVDARESLVNALTSLVGNADLVLLSEHPLPEELVEQVRTIHEMALRVNGVLRGMLTAESGKSAANSDERLDAKAVIRKQRVPVSD
jgi:hypothetical protein